jgi:hypothetical protein
MNVLNRIHPMRNHPHRLALAGSTARIASSLAALALATTPAHSQLIPGGDFQMYKPGTGYTVTAAFADGASFARGVGDGIDLAGGSVNYSDLTSSVAPNDTIPDIDLPGWAPLQTQNDLLNNGVGGSTGMNIFAAWGGNCRIQTTGSLFTVATGQTVTITAMVGGPDDGPIGGPLAFHLVAGGVQLVPTSFIDPTLPNGGAFQMISRTYSAAVLAPHVGASTTIVLGVEDANSFGNRVIFDDVTLVASVPDTTPPTLTSFEDNKGGGPIVVNEPVTYTVTFSEPMSAATVDVTDFANTGTTATTVNSVTPTANPAVFLVGATPNEAGTLQLQVMAGATLTDLEGNPLNTDSAILDDSSIVVDDLPPTPTTIVLVSSGSPTTYGQNVTFTATVSPIPSGGTVQFWDGENYLDGGAPVTVNTSTGEATYSTTALDVATHQITADYSGNFQFAASSTAAPVAQQVGQAPLTVRASDTIRPTNSANPDPLPYQITGFQNGENLGTSGVTGTPVLSTDAVLESPVGDYVITCALGSLAASNYSFTLVNGTLTVAEVANTFSVNFYVGPDWPFGGLTTDEQKANVRVETSTPAGFGDWMTSGWSNFLVPWQPAAPLAPVTLTSNKGSSATFTFKDCRNGYTYNGPRTTLLGDGNGNMMDAHVNSTLEGESNKFDMEVTNIPFAVYDVIFYIGANLPQFGDGTGVIKFNGGSERAFTLKPGAFDGTFTEMVDATTPGNYIVFTGVTGSSFTTQTWGTGPSGFNHIGPNGFQIRQAAGTAGFNAWADAYAPGQTPDQDHDFDGVENGIEYFMGETGSSFTAMPGLDATNTVTWPMVAGYLGTYEVQTSPDLGIWTNVDPRPEPSAGNLSYTLPTGLGKRFVRLLVTPTL